MSRRDDPKWVNHPRWGWLVDEVPLFEARWSGHLIPSIWELRTVGGVENGALHLFDERDLIDGLPPSGTLDLDYSSAPYFPLTTAARELLAALRAEAGK